MKIKAKLHWGLDKGEIDTELMYDRADFKKLLKEGEGVTLASFEFPKGVEYDLEFYGQSLELKKQVDGEPRP